MLEILGHPPLLDSPILRHTSNPLPIDYQYSLSLDPFCSLNPDYITPAIRLYGCLFLGQNPPKVAPKSTDPVWPEPSLKLRIYLSVLVEGRSLFRRSFWDPRKVWSPHPHPPPEGWGIPSPLKKGEGIGLSFRQGGGSRRPPCRKEALGSWLG